jgi:hypothetical protein
MVTKGEYVTVFEAAQRLRISEPRIRSWMNRKLLPTRQGARLKLVDLGAAAQLMATRASLSVPR